MNTDYRTLSHWLATVPGSLKPRAALQGDVQADVVIVGGGYTGLWTAWYLKELDPALRIMVLEAEIAGYGASGRNGGWCSAFISNIESWCETDAERDGAIRLQRLMFDTVREIGEVARSNGIDCHYAHEGALEIAVLPQQLERLREELAGYRELGFGEEDFRWLEATEISDAARIDGALGGIHAVHCAAVHPARLARGLADLVEARGVTICERSPATRVEPGRVSTPHGSIRADRIVLATEGYGSHLTGHPYRLMPVHSMMVVTEPLSRQQLDQIGLARRYCFSVVDRIVTYGQRTADNRIAFGCRGSYRFGGRVRQFNPQDPDFELVRKTLLRLFPTLAGVRFENAWGGAMGVTRWLQPSINFDPRSGLAWTGGYFGNGVAASHLAGRTTADLLCGRETERTATPWVNPSQPHKAWEPEPLRWLGIQSRSRLMQWADHAEYKGSAVAPALHRILGTFFP